jgi:hypothetical protein
MYRPKAKTLLLKQKVNTSDAHAQDLTILHQHICSWYPNAIKTEIAVVGAVHAEFATDLADFNARQGLVSFFISELDYERVDPITFTLCVELGKNDGVIRRMTH